MRRHPLLVAALAAALVPVVSAPAPAHFTTRNGERCKRVVFTPQSDDVADGIRKREISCKRARRIIRIVRRRGERTPLGFTCRFQTHDARNGLAHTDIACTNTGNRRVSWAQY